MGDTPKSWDDVNGTAHLNEASMEVTHTEFMRWKNRIEELEAKLAKVVEALKFYAEVDNYEDQHKPESCGCCYYLHDAEIKEDQGAKARITLAELTGGKKDGTV